MRRLIATLAAIVLALAAPGSVAAVTTTSTTTTYFRADSNDCLEGAATCEERFLELAGAPGTVADVCFTILQLQAIDELGYEITSLEQGCSQVGPTEYSIAADGTMATVTLNDFRLDTCPNGGAPEDCTSSRTADVTVSLVGTDTTITRATWTTRDGGCVTIYRQVGTATTATGSITVDGTSYATTSALIGSTTQTVKSTCG
jgi:hypothetical protein